MSDTTNLTFKDNAWWSCGCGGKPKKIIKPPDNSTAIFMKAAEKMNGPVTGIEYEFQPHQNSIDVDSEDAAVWLKAGKARPQLTGYKGRLTRTGKVNGKKP